MNQHNPPLISPRITLTNMAPIANRLRQEFYAAHGEEAFKEHYINHFNEKPSMQARTFNRSAQPLLATLFLSVVLKKGKTLQDALIDGFTAEAEKPWDGQKETFTHKMRDQILYDLQDTTDKISKGSSAVIAMPHANDDPPSYITPAA